MITTIAANKQTNRDKMIDVVCGDNNTKIVRLVVPITVDGVDLSGLMWHIKFINASGERDFHKASNIEITDDAIHVDWTIRGKATSKPGITQFQFEGFSDEDLVWQTSKMYLRVKDRIEVPEENTDEEESLTELQQLIIYVSSELSNVIAAGNDARDAASHPPIIGENNNWFVYDWETKQYIDTGKPSRGSGGNGSGEDGGYYTPTVSDDGELTWESSKEGMPEIPAVNIKGPKGEDGKDGANGKDGVDGQDGSSGVYIGEQEPTDPNVNVWIKPDGEATENMYELIETVVLEEAVTRVNMGPYNLKKAYVEVFTPAADAASAGVIAINGINAVYVGTMVATSSSSANGRIVKCVADVENGMLRCFGQACNASDYSQEGLSPLYQRAFAGYMVAKIESVSIFATPDSKTLPEGTVITIKGVRA